MRLVPVCACTCSLCVINTKIDGGTLWKSWLRLHSQTPKEANDVFIYVAHRLHQCVPYLQDITWFYGTHEMHSIFSGKQRTGFVAAIFTKLSNG